MGTIDLIHATPNTVEAIRKAHAIRKDLMPEDSFQYSFPPSKPYFYNGQWAVQREGYCFKIPASSFGNLILTEDRVFATVHDELVSSSVDFDNIAWCYLRVTLSSAVYLVAYSTPFQNPIDYADYPDDYVPLAVYSPETGLIQLQYGPVRLNRYWIYDDGSGSGGESGGGEAL